MPEEVIRKRPWVAVGGPQELGNVVEVHSKELRVGCGSRLRRADRKWRWVRGTDSNGDKARQREEREALALN
jgi:hypothetical protein